MPDKIALLTNFKDEAENALHVAQCLNGIANEWIVLDSGSTDGTQKLCRDRGAHVYEIPDVFEYEDVSELWNPGRKLSGYGDLRTLDKWLAKKHGCDWCLIIDGDERILPHDAAKFNILRDLPIDFVWLPRQHYHDYEMHFCENPILENHPDLQPRFFRTRPELHFIRRVHEMPREMGRELRSLDCPVIRHFGWCKTDERKAMIKSMCDRLWKMETDEEIQRTYEKENAAGTSMPNY